MEFGHSSMQKYIYIFISPTGSTCKAEKKKKIMPTVTGFLQAYKRL